MDYVDHPTAIRAIVRTVEDEVLPQVTDKYARSQLWAALGILSNVAEELGQPTGVPGGAGRPAGEPLGVTAARMYDEVSAQVARQRSLHYRKAVSGT
ncbi:hypothetical protein [Nocardia higoensis]|uniref:hypothetical protein n=1 Tax=Nocardia higoensis TaxID=228599 RepID=UPI00030D9CF3|nr:hypothetical protein [Nocardia higoensis]